MNEERFTVMKKFDGSYVICDKGKMLVADDCCDLLNELNKDFEELGISIKLFEDDIATKDKKIDEQQAEIEQLKDDVYDELDKALKVLEEIYEDYPKNNVHRLYNNLKGLKEMIR